MQFTLDTAEGKHQIRGYQKGEIKIDDKIYSSSVIVTPTTIVHWEPQRIQDLRSEHLIALLAFSPALIVLGTGENPHFLKPEMTFPFLQKGIGVEIMTTAAACRTYNVLVSEGRAVVAGLFLE